MAIYSRFDDFEYLRWSKEVKIRDHYSCVVCGRRGSNIGLNSHHLNAWASFPEERYDLCNGVSLCSSCHDAFHHLYGKGNNTKEQFEEFEKIFSLLIAEATFQVKVEMATKKTIKLLDGYEIAKLILENEWLPEDGYSF
jgi:hypothetical protein